MSLQTKKKRKGRNTDAHHRQHTRMDSGTGRENSFLYRLLSPSFSITKRQETILLTYQQNSQKKKKELRTGSVETEIIPSAQATNKTEYVDHPPSKKKPPPRNVQAKIKH